MMGADQQILSPAAEKLNQFVALGSGGQYANYQSRHNCADTSGVSSAGAVTGGMDSQRGLTS